MDETNAMEDNPWVRRFLDDVDTQRVSEEQVPRVEKLLRLIADEGIRRGYAVLRPDDAEMMDKHQDDLAWAHIAIRKEDVTYFMQVSESSQPGMPAREPFSHKPGQTGECPAWMDARNYEFAGTGVLTLAIRSEVSQWHQRTCKDSDRTHIEDRLGKVFDSLDLGSKRREQERRYREERERRKQEMYAAYRLEKLVETLKQRSGDYQEWLQQGEYLNLLERAVLRQDGGISTPFQKDLDTLREHLRASNPWNDTDNLPFEIPKPSDYELELFERHRDGARHPYGFDSFATNNTASSYRDDAWSYSSNAADRYEYGGAMSAQRRAERGYSPVPVTVNPIEPEYDEVPF
ncbi:hypothetical protein BLEM_1081 [Bifidobacterium lemurum]|uniref:Uncharacterized protein n=1 Tax=Bifidobacterium lemurum TaxID=1603886 RepID=A0A261FUC1_9BIFI|nr:hypothetical protein [Bifidobacterium lemurum]OZG62535.1 hypothetical protein BLEM_1081 [Bifidobacterium lemurum]QOL33869.1 hypothetical protein BL8807_08865 [Bifidobacterium lemurum]